MPTLFHGLKTIFVLFSAESRQFHFRSPPEPLPRPKSHSRSSSSEKMIQGDARNLDDEDSNWLGKRTQSAGSYSGISPRRGSYSLKSPHHESVSIKSGKSPRHDSVSNSSGKSPRHDSVSNANGKSPRHDSVSKSRRSGSFSKKATSPDKISVKELSEDLNQFFAAKTHQVCELFL